MDKYVKESLKKVKKAKLPKYNDKTLHLIISKLNNVIKTFELNKCYLIKVEPYIVNPYEGFTLHDNWNKGTHPLNEFMKIEVIQIMGNMIKVNSVGYNNIENKDTNNVWVGWLPIKSTHIIEEL